MQRLTLAVTGTLALILWPHESQAGGVVVAARNTVEKKGAAPKVAPIVSPAPSPVKAVPTTPVITGIKTVVAHGAPRPNLDVFYAGEPLQVFVSGSVVNATSADGRCGYSVTLEHMNKQIVTESHFDSFDVHPIGTPPAAGEYRIVAESTVRNATPGCIGHIERTVKIHDPNIPWLVDVQLLGYGFRFPAGDDGAMPQFCENCDSIFSPAHNTGFLRILPVLQFGGKGKCSYSITQHFDNDVRQNGEWFTGGSPVIPAGRGNYGTSGFSPLYADMPPFLNSWNNKKSVVTVTLQPEKDTPQSAGIPNPPPPCQIAASNAEISKTITFTDDQTLPPVKK